MSIGVFAARTRLSAKALRLYDELQLVVPAHVDPVTGYRRYAESQVGRARLVGRLRRLDMPLAMISSIITQDGNGAAEALRQWWSRVESDVVERRTLVEYLQAQLRGEDPTMYEIAVHPIPERHVVSVCRHLHIGDADAFFAAAFTRLRAAGPGLGGVAGAPFLIFHGEVSADSDGPMELCRPVSTPVPADPAGGLGVHDEAAHDEVYIRLTMKEMGWPAMAPACDALETWLRDTGREPCGPLRQVLIADQRTATPDTPVCDLSIPLSRSDCESVHRPRSSWRDK